MYNLGLIIILLIAVIVFLVRKKEYFKEYFNNKTKNQLTIGIKTFCRPHVLNQSLNIMHTKNNTIYPIIIADDSLDIYKKQNLRIINNYRKRYNSNIRILNLPFDSGLSKGRNEIVSKCNTKYIMILDDSRTFTSQLDIYKMIQFLEKNNKYHLFCGIVNNRNGIDRKYAGLFKSIKQMNGGIHIKTKPPTRIQTKLFNSIEETNIGLNVFIAKTDCLKRVRWRNDLKIGEHELFFYDFYKYGYRCVVSNDCNFIQLNNTYYPRDLIKYRNRASHEYNPDKKIRIYFSKQNLY
jgi:hypothetical protein